MSDVLPARAGDGALTKKSPPLEVVWPAVSRRLVSWLERRGVDSPTAHDVCQESAARLVARDVAYSDAGELFAWVSVVAWRIFLDGQRRDRRLSYEVPDTAAPVDVAREVEDLDRVARVVASFPQLSPAERKALIDTETVDGRREQSKLAKRRQRARQHLLALMEGVAAIVGWLRMRLRGLRPEIAVAIASPVLFACALVALPYAGHHAIPTSQPGRPHAASLVGAAPVTTPPGVNAATTPLGARRTGAVRPVPQVQARVPTPLGPASIGARPKAADDHFLCTVDLLGVGSHCIDLPIKLTG